MPAAKIRGVIWVLTLTLSISGCTTNDSASPDETGPQPEPEAPDLNVTTEPPNPNPPPREALNQSYRFPSAGMGASFDDRFDVAPDARRMLVHITTFLDCPVGYQDDPVVTFTAPNGSTTSMSVLPEAMQSSRAWTCSDTSEASQGEVTLELEAGGGTWTLKSSGEMTGRSQIRVATDV